MSETKKPSGFLLNSSVLAIARSLVGVPYEHPLDTVKTVMQSQQTNRGAFGTIRDIYSRKGIKGFYSGVIPNTTRIVLKGMYRFPLMVSLPNLFNSLSEKLFNKDLSQGMCKTLTGIALAFFEVLVITPTQRLKVWLMTRQQTNMNIRYFFRNCDHIAPELFKGLGIVFFKQMTSWVTFLLTDHYLKSQLRQRQNIESTELLPFWQLMLVSVGVGAVNTFFVLPLDFIKTRIQSVEKNQRASIIGTARESYRKEGFKAFYSGWRVRAVQYFVQSILTVNLYEILQTGYKQVLKK